MNRLANEYWFNVYASGHRGMPYLTREDAELAGTPSYVERPDSAAKYRIHVTWHPPSHRNTAGGVE